MMLAEKEAIELLYSDQGCHPITRCNLDQNSIEEARSSEESESELEYSVAFLKAEAACVHKKKEVIH